MKKKIELLQSHLQGFQLTVGMKGSLSDQKMIYLNQSVNLLT